MFERTFWTGSEGAALVDAALAALQAHTGDVGGASLFFKNRYKSEDPSKLTSALQFAAGREAAIKKFGPWAARGWFFKQSAEQATHPLVSAHHAERFKGAKRILELCAGAGSDTAALAKVSEEVTTLESDSTLSWMLEENLKLQGISNVRVNTGRAEDFVSDLDLSTFNGVWCDPSRRGKDGGRIANPQAWSPPLSFLLGLHTSAIIGIKISPATDVDISMEWKREWIGLEKECVEQILWRTESLCEGTVTLPEFHLTWVPDSAKECSISPRSDLRGKFLIEPHGALIRSGYLQNFYGERRISILDTRIAYGISNEAIKNSPWCECFEILDFFPYNLDTLNEKLQARTWSSRTEIKKRGFPVEPEELRKRLALKPSDGDSPWGTIILTKIEDEHFCFLTSRTRL